jgi:hypothetical protein
MDFYILIDLSHNETLHSIGGKIADSTDFIFEFLDNNDDLTEYERLSKYSLIILGDPHPRKNSSELLFTPTELKTLKRYVKSGGNLLLSSSSKGDEDVPQSLGSLRVLKQLTGVKQFPCGILFLPKSQPTYKKNTNLILDQFANHQILADFESGDQIVLGKCTYLILDPEIKSEVILSSNIHTNYYSEKWNYKDHIGVKPLCVINKFGKGLVATIATTEIFTADPERGINVQSNSKFVLNLITFLADNYKNFVKKED